MPQRSVLLTTGALVLGEFRCPPGDRMWQEVNEIGDLPHVVWPLTTVEIERAGFGRVCADPNTVVLYDPGTAYRRRRVAGAGDRSLFLALSQELLHHLPTTALNGDRGRFVRGHLFCSSRSWLVKEQLAAAARSGAVDAMRLEEMALDAAYDALCEPAPDGSQPDRLLPDRAQPRRRVRARIEQARLMLGERVDEPLQVTSVAKALDVSPFHLARQFRAATGTSMAAYRQQLRLRGAMQRALEDPRADLAAVAAEHGFASHSHFTATCRRNFGTTPSTLRRRVLEPHVT